MDLKNFTFDISDPRANDMLATDHIYIGLDVDSTVIGHCFPDMQGKDIGAIPWLAIAQDKFPVVFLMNTMRSGESLQLAIDWLEARGVKIGGSGAHPTQHLWTTSPKCHCHLYVDDRAVGTPLDKDRNINWTLYGPMLLAALDKLP